jgi:hypothetical protein
LIEQKYNFMIYNNAISRNHCSLLVETVSYQMPWSFQQKLQQAEPASFLIAKGKKRRLIFFKNIYAYKLEFMNFPHTF